MPKIRVLVVEDSMATRRLLAQSLASEQDLELVGTAGDGQAGLVKVEALKPDVVILDIEMPVMNGVQMLKVLRKSHPRLPVIMFSTLTERGAAVTMEALVAGASDYLLKPSSDSVERAMQYIREELVPKIMRLHRRPREAAVPVPVQMAVPPTSPTPPAKTGGAPAIVAIGVSTGGPNTLATFLPLLGTNFPVPVVIVQHMPPLFTQSLAARLSKLTAAPVREGMDGAVLRPGEVWIAPGGRHMEVEPDAGGAKLRLHDGPPENSCRPAVDVLFRSVARVHGPRALAVILTGMGQDGLIGARHIREAGGSVLAQDKESSVVWGMPGAVAEAGLAEKVLPLAGLAEEISGRARRAPAWARPASPMPASQLPLAKSI